MNEHNRGRRKPAQAGGVNELATAWLPSGAAAVVSSSQAHLLRFRSGPQVVRPVVAMERAHTAGVNGLAAAWLPSGAAAVVSGGDDQALRVVALDLPLAAAPAHSCPVEGQAPSGAQAVQAQGADSAVPLPDPAAAARKHAPPVPAQARAEGGASAGSSPRASLARAAPAGAAPAGVTSATAAGQQCIGAVVRVTNAHSSAVRGVWTDGRLAFTTGLDQRVRGWRLAGSLAWHPAHDTNNGAGGLRQQLPPVCPAKPWRAGEVASTSHASDSTTVPPASEGDGARKQGVLLQLQQAGSIVSQVLEPACVTVAAVSASRFVVAAAGRGLQVLTWNDSDGPVAGPVAETYGTDKR